MANTFFGENNKQNAGGGIKPPPTGKRGAKGGGKLNMKPGFGGAKAAGKHGPNRSAGVAKVKVNAASDGI